MKDLKLNENFEVVIDHRKDLGMLEGREEFEQNIAIGLTQFFTEEIGSVNYDGAKSRLRLYAGQLANESPRAGTVASIFVEDSETTPNTFEVRIVYRGGDTFEFDIS